MNELPRLVTAGDPRHGVVRYAREVASAVGARVGRDLAVTDPAAAPGPLHVHFTDRVWGPSPEAAADRVVRLAARVPLTVTLHDVPQPSDGPRNLGRRADSYRRVAAVARAVACNSRHEQALLERYSQTSVSAVHPLPVILRRAGERPPPDDDVTLLGYVYPGKGHAEAIAAVGALTRGRPGAPRLGVSALGGASDGHAALLGQLAAQAARAEVRFAASGYLGEDELVARSRRARVPLAAHRHVSASGSIGAWIGAGRRPLVPDSAYGRELAALRPGTVTLYRDLPAAITRALEHPASTWWDDGVATAPDLDDVAAAYLAWWAQDVAW